MTDGEKLAEENILLIEEGISVLDLISETDYLAMNDDASSAAEHFRHIANHYDALLSGNTRVDYESRPRLHPVGQSLAAALTHLRGLVKRLKEGRLPENLVIERAVTHADGRLESIGMPTNAARELDFVASHTIHHYAIVAMLLKARGVSMPPQFGMSRATLRDALPQRLIG